MPTMINGYRAEGFDTEDVSDDADMTCDHIAQVSISTMEIQCMDCLRKWPKPANFKSDFPEQDRG